MVMRLGIILLTMVEPMVMVYPMVMMMTSAYPMVMVVYAMMVMADTMVVMVVVAMVVVVACPVTPARHHFRLLKLRDIIWMINRHVDVRKP